MTDAKTFIASLKAALEEALGMPVEVQSTPDTIIIHPTSSLYLPLVCKLDCQILQSHLEDIDGETITVIDDFKIVSVQLIQDREEKP